MFHERSSQVVGDDDPLKVVGWIGSGLVLLWIASRETPLRAARLTLLAGFVLQTLSSFLSVFC